MIHRALLGSIERFFAILIENYKGNLPTWLAPTQVAVLPISDNCVEYAEAVHAKLLAYKVRSEIDNSQSTINYKIRNAELQKIPYMAIIGKREVQTEKISVRRHGTGKIGELTIQELAKQITQENTR
jgi:threonyl-tRNA synthetase